MGQYQRCGEYTGDVVPKPAFHPSNDAGIELATCQEPTGY